MAYRRNRRFRPRAAGKNRTQLKATVAIVAIFTARFLAVAWFYPGHDGDIAWQQFLGLHVLHDRALPDRLGNETFTASGAPWIAQEWLLGVAVAETLPRGQFAILACVATLLAGAALYVTALRARTRGASHAATAFVTACVAFSTVDVFGVRAQVAAWPLFAALLLLLDLENDWLFLAVPTVVLWANVHASAALAPAIVGIWAVGTALEERAWTPRVRRSALLAAATAIALLLTPLGWHLPLYAIELLRSPIRSGIVEWQLPDVTYLAFCLGFLPLVAAGVYCGVVRERKAWRDGLLFAAGLFIGCTALRNVPLAALLIAPMVTQRATNLSAAAARIETFLRTRSATLLLYAAAAAAAAVFVLQLARTPASARVSLPVNALNSIARIRGEHNVYCEDFAWCSLALSRTNLRTFVDGRCDAFPLRVWNDYEAIAHVRPDWERLATRYGVDAMLVRVNSPLAQVLAAQGHWRPAYRDVHYAVFWRGGAPAE